VVVVGISAILLDVPAIGAAMSGLLGVETVSVGALKLLPTVGVETNAGDAGTLTDNFESRKPEPKETGSTAYTALAAHKDATAAIERTPIISHPKRVTTHCL